MSVPISELVKGWDDVLRSYTQPELNDWAKRQGIDDKVSFIKFKKALMQIGIDYNALKQAYHEKKEEELASLCTHQVTLIADAEQTNKRYAICDIIGNVLWHGKFFDYEPESQADAQLDAAKKAIWLAGKIKETIKSPAIRLNLRVDAEWISWQDSDRRVLEMLAKKNSIELKIDPVPSSDNLADNWTVKTGFKKWQENDLETLAIKLK